MYEAELAKQESEFMFEYKLVYPSNLADSVRCLSIPRTALLQTKW